MNEPANDPRHSLRLVRRMLALIWSVAPGWTGLVAVLAVVLGLLPLVPLYLLKSLVDALIPGVHGHPPVTHVVEIVALIAATAFLVLVVSGLQRLANAHQSTRVGDRVTELLEAQAVRLDLAHYERPQFHDALHRAQTEATSGPQAVVGALVSLLSGLVGLIGVATLLATLDWWVGPVLALAALPGLLVRRLQARRLFRQQREHTPALRYAWYYGWLATSPLAAQEVRTYGLGGLFAGRAHSIRQRLAGERLRLTATRTRYEVLADGVAVVAAMGMLAAVAIRAAHGAITVGEIVIFYQAVQRGQSMLTQLTSSASTLLQGSLFLSHLYDFLDLRPSIVAPANARPVPARLREGIVFEGVSYCYEDAPARALQDVDLRIEPGERIALVGANGAGKSTLIKLLIRLYDPSTGRITLDGTDLRELDPTELRARFAVVVQNHLNYELTAEESIALGDVRRQPDRERIESAARAAGAHERITRLRHGYDTQLGRFFAGGEALSVGEGQRVAIARALVRDAPVLVLDEPTSAMDAAAERELVRRFNDLTTDRTSIVVSHRLSTVRLADRIVVLERGRIVESGSHDQLIARGETYARLFTELRGPPQLAVA